MTKFKTLEEHDDAVREWLARYAGQTHAMYRVQMGKLVSRLKAGPREAPQTASRQEILAVAAYWREDVSAASWNQMVAAWRGFYAWLHAEGVIETNPLVPGVLRNRRVLRTLRTLPTASDLEKLWSLLMDKELYDDAPERSKRTILRDRAWFALASRAGMTPGEMVRIRVSDVDLDDESVVVPPLRSTQTDPLDPSLRRAMDRVTLEVVRPLTTNVSRKRYLLSTHANGRALRNGAIGEQFARIAKAAGVTGLTLLALSERYRAALTQGSAVP